MPNAVKFKAQFDAVIADITARFIDAQPVEVNSWQSVKAPQPMPEILNYSFTLDPGHRHLLLPELQKAIGPNLPWADDHFRTERVSGSPINPGRTWRTWPYALSADKHRREGAEDPKFDHSYAERYWPKFAGVAEGQEEPLHGIRFRYGDLSDLITLMGHDPLTRQGYLPVWFPEDLAAATESKRVPCTLGYHFIRRQDRLHVIYPMRSCDFVRHFRDDVYLTLRLQHWLLSMLQYHHPSTWSKDVLPGTFTMHITSLHMFQLDQQNLIHGLKGK